MDWATISASPYYTWVILPFLIFLARIGDVSISTIRVIFISKGFKHMAPVLGFLEILIWLLAIGQIFQNLHNPLCYIAYAGGFAMGNYIGITIVDKLSLGQVLVRIITRRDAVELLSRLRQEEIGVTSVEAQGPIGPVKILFSIIKRCDLKRVVDIVKQYNPHAFYSVEDISFVSMGQFPESRPRRRMLNIFRAHRKSK
ncbi:MAG: DUF2179 domain-containing protein [Acidobacteria bacterium]|nr:DUF2179 domain-containing protein [Acidobacteriota bacterium]